MRNLFKYLTVLVICLMGIFSIAGCSSSDSPVATTTTISELKQVQAGDTVKVDYTLKLQDGTVFETSLGDQPMEVTLGQGQLFPMLEQAIVGMKIGASKVVNIPVDQAFGPRQAELIQVVSRDKLPADVVPEVGMQLQTTQIDGTTAVVTITEVTDTTVTIDSNSPLAGQDLTFDIKLVSIEPAGPQPSSTSSQGSELTAILLKQALTNGRPTLAEFGRGTCIPCKEMKPILEDLAVQYKDKMNVSIVSVDDYDDLTSAYRVLAIPTQIIFDKDGDEIFRHVGFWAKDQIISQLNKSGIK